MIAVKGPALAEVAQSIQPLLGPNTIVLPAMNGVPWWFCLGLPDFPGGPLESVDPGGRIAIDYGVYGIPETFFIGRDGRILTKHIGALGSARLRASLDATLAGSAVSQEPSSKGAYQPIR